MKGDGEKKSLPLANMFPLCPYLSVKRLILEQQCRVEVVLCVSAPCWEMKSTVNVLFPPHSCLSWNIFNPNKKTCIYTKRCPRLSFLPRRTLKGAIEFPTNKQVDPRGFPRGSPQLWWLGYLPSFVRRGSKNSNIYSNYLDEGLRRGKKKGGGGELLCPHPHTRTSSPPRCLTEREGYMMNNVNTPCKRVWAVSGNQHFDRPAFRAGFQLILFTWMAQKDESHNASVGFTVCALFNTKVRG